MTLLQSLRLWAGISPGPISIAVVGLSLPRHGPSYYAAFVIDPDGYPIEAVCQQSVGDAQNWRPQTSGCLASLLLRCLLRVTQRHVSSLSLGQHWSGQQTLD
jgi:hypothetical protein